MKKLRFSALAAITILTSLLALQLTAAPANLPDAVLSLDSPGIQRIIAVQESVTADLMNLEGILGTAVGQDELGELAMIVFVDTDNASKGEIMRALPRGIKGVKVLGELTDKFRAMPAKGGSGKGGVSHTAIQKPPIHLGTSGGWGYDLANGYCCGGTLGSLINIGGVQYILSNYHVLEADIVAGGNGITATAGRR
jgi:hypothetical protein